VQTHNKNVNKKLQIENFQSFILRTMMKKKFVTILTMHFKFIYMKLLFIQNVKIFVHKKKVKLKILLGP